MDYGLRFAHMAALLSQATPTVVSLSNSLENASKTFERLGTTYKTIGLNELTPPGPKATRKEKKAWKRLRTALRVGQREA